MREIKFRAWDKADRKMKSVDAIRFYKQRDMKKFFGEGYIKYALTLSEQYADNTLISGVVDDEAILMQYTGFKDKNGKEIYEGDIIESRIGCEPGNPGRFEVYFDTGSGAWCCDDAGGRELGTFYRVIKEGKPDGNYIAVKVIGNIYENPELLEEKKWISF